MLLCKKHIIEQAEFIFSYIYPAEEAAGSKSRQSLSWRNQTDGTDNWQTDTRTDTKTVGERKHGRQKEGRMETAEKSQTDRVNASGMGLWDKNPLDTAAPSRPPFLPPISPCSNTLAGRPSGRQDCFCRGTLAASFLHWLIWGFGKLHSSSFKHNEQTGWMSAIVPYLQGRWGQRGEGF